MNDVQIEALQKSIEHVELGERIALWAEKFVGLPYDPDPLGEYVRESVIVADERVDCMYLTFRAVELALGKDPEDAVRVALDKRFKAGGKMRDGKVMNYDNRFQYGEDMMESGKWGREITFAFRETASVKGSRGKDSVTMIPADEILKQMNLLRSGDIIFFVVYPGRRAADEVVGHIGIIKRENEGVYLIHASGKKGGGGRVQKVLFADYVGTMPFAGIRVTRFPSD